MQLKGALGCVWPVPGCATDPESPHPKTHELPDEEILPIYNLLASYEMGECHLAQNRPRVVGDLSAAEGYINKVLQSEGEVSRAEPFH